MAESTPPAEFVKLAPEVPKVEQKSEATTSSTAHENETPIKAATVLPLQADDPPVATVSEPKTTPEPTPTPATATATITEPHQVAIEAAVASAAPGKASISTSAVAPAPTTPAAAAAASADAPDPDEDDLDDLDDMLDDFNAAKLDERAATDIDTGAAAAAASSSAAVDNPFLSPPNNADGSLLDSDEFARQLHEGMADLLGELQASPEIQAQLEQMMQELGAGAVAPSIATRAAKSTSRDAGLGGGGATTAPAPAPAPAPAAPAAPAPEGAGGPSPSFQESIRRTMERMQASGDAAGQAATEAGDSDADLMAALLKEMEAGGMGMGAGEGDEDLSKMLLGMMEQLTNKEILYEPMKELDDKFPAWFEANRSKTSARGFGKIRDTAQVGQGDRGQV